MQKKVLKVLVILSILMVLGTTDAFPWSLLNRSSNSSTDQHVDVEKAGASLEYSVDKSKIASDGLDIEEEDDDDSLPWQLLQKEMESFFQYLANKYLGTES